MRIFVILILFFFILIGVERCSSILSPKIESFSDLDELKNPYTQSVACTYAKIFAFEKYRQSYGGPGTELSRIDGRQFYVELTRDPSVNHRRLRERTNQALIDRIYGANRANCIVVGHEQNIYVGLRVVHPDDKHSSMGSMVAESSYNVWLKFWDSNSSLPIRGEDLHDLIRSGAWCIFNPARQSCEASLDVTNPRAQSTSPFTDG